jgi:hypothetical protein
MDIEHMATNTNQFIVLTWDRIIPVNTTTEVAAAAAAVARAGLPEVQVWTGDGEGAVNKTDLKIFAEGDGGVTFSAYSDRGEPARRLTANRAFGKNWVDCDSHATAAAAAARANALPGWARWKLVNLIWEENLDVEEALFDVEKT